MDDIAQTSWPHSRMITTSLDYEVPRQNHWYFFENLDMCPCQNISVHPYVVMTFFELTK
jgi:hypothetical protein